MRCERQRSQILFVATNVGIPVYLGGCGRGTVRCSPQLELVPPAWISRLDLMLDGHLAGTRHSVLLLGVHPLGRSIEYVRS